MKPIYIRVFITNKKFEILVNLLGTRCPFVDVYPDGAKAGYLGVEIDGYIYLPLSFKKHFKESK